MATLPTDVLWAQWELTDVQVRLTDIPLDEYGAYTFTVLLDDVAAKDVTLPVLKPQKVH